MNNKNKMYFYDSIADHFDAVVNRYDTQKRLEVVFKEFLPEKIKGKKLLDAGCGTGWFSQAAVKRGAIVTSMDIGKNLLQEVKKKCKSKLVVGSILKMPFKDNTFDIVVSSEVIEHVTAPLQAVRELHRVLKPGGILVLTTPNKFWHPAVEIANALHLRPYQGLENWQSWDDLTNEFARLKMIVEKNVGIHVFPFVLAFTYPFLDWAHQFRQPLKKYMINLAFRCRKAQKNVRKKSHRSAK